MKENLKKIQNHKNLLIIFLTTFIAILIFQLFQELTFHSLKISFYYLLAKIYVLVGIENTQINIVGSFGMVAAKKAVDVVSNFYVIEIAKNTLKIFWSSVLNSAFYSGCLLMILVLLSNIKIGFGRSKKISFNFWKIINSLLVKFEDISNNLTAVVCDKKHLTIQKKALVDSKILKSQQNIGTKKSSNKSKNYLLITDKNLPYPIIKKVVLVEPKE